MAQTEHPSDHRAVAPLELFFDLVFVFAISQLTHHLIEHLTWHGALETLIALVAVCGVWGFTSFDLTLLDITRSGTQALALVAMGLGLFMNAGISHAYDDSPWLFVVPMLLALVGPGLYAARFAPTAQLREHYRRVLLWFCASTPLWIIGCLSEERRLWFWAVAAAIDLAGSWTAHPTPGRTTRTEAHAFDAEHMLERMRLFLIILLGETVLTLGRVVADHHDDVTTIVMALGGFTSLVCLWFAYFGRTEQAVIDRAAASEDPIRSVHVGLNVIYGVVAGLVLLAAGSEIMLAHAHDSRAGAAGVLVLVGPALYLVAQGIYFWVETGVGWQARAGAAVLLALAAVAAFWLPAPAVVAVQTALLLLIAGRLGRARPSREVAAV